MIIKLRKIRKEKNITLIELSQRSGVPKSVLSRIERDLTSPTMVQIEWIATALGVRINDLFDSDVK